MRTAPKYTTSHLSHLRWIHQPPSQPSPPVGKSHKPPLLLTHTLHSPPLVSRPRRPPILWSQAPLHLPPRSPSKIRIAHGHVPSPGAPTPATSGGATPGSTISPTRSRTLAGSGAAPTGRPMPKTASDTMILAMRPRGTPRVPRQGVGFSRVGSTTCGIISAGSTRKWITGVRRYRNFIRAAAGASYSLRNLFG